MNMFILNAMSNSYDTISLCKWRPVIAPFTETPFQTVACTTYVWYSYLCKVCPRPVMPWHIAMLYFSVLWMLKYSIGWRPSIWGGGRLFRPLLRLFLTFLSQFFCKMSNFYISPSQRKNLEFINSFYPPEIGRYFLGFFSLHELRLFCMNWGCFAQIEVVLHRLRLPCTDWGCPAQIEVALHRLRLSCTNFDRIWIDEAFLLWKKELWPWGLYVEAFLRGSEARRSSWNLDK